MVGLNAGMMDFGKVGIALIDRQLHQEELFDVLPINRPTTKPTNLTVDQLFLQSDFPLWPHMRRFGRSMLTHSCLKVVKFLLLVYLFYTCTV